MILCSQLRVEDIVIRGLKWSKLLDPDKSGHWWLSSNMAFLADNNAEEVAARIEGDVLEVQKMLQLAATLWMNTDARRAIFCVIMTSVDVLDAFQKLLRLDLPGKQVVTAWFLLLFFCLLLFHLAILNSYVIFRIETSCELSSYAVYGRNYLTNITPFWHHICANMTKPRSILCR